MCNKTSGCEADIICIQKGQVTKRMHHNMESDGRRKVLCGANAYEQKYYFNEKEFGNLPESIKDELHIICVLFTEEVGGIFMIVIEEDGSISMDTQSAEDDFYYDEVSSGLLINQIRMKRSELFESLSMYYRVFYLHEDIKEL